MMRKLITIVFGLLLTANYSCTREEVATPSIVGKWLLTQSYIDPGDGSGSPQISTTKAIFTFNSDGTANTTGPFFGLITNYTVKGDSELLFVFSNGQSVRVNYRLTGSGLVLWAVQQCDEGCVFEYQRINVLFPGV